MRVILCNVFPVHRCRYIISLTFVFYLNHNLFQFFKIKTTNRYWSVVLTVSLSLTSFTALEYACIIYSQASPCVFS
nr:MAG TPA: hypothetical protein [Caudoviricetes sp.]DAU14927.1 MAG TPA: hypothetical protein [Caudoviricetes sp.]DAY85755.1 MAG TPA: hypothetical protein [Caudoviricetes sp.]